MVHIKISEAKAGMILAEDVYGTNSVIYAAAGNTLTQKMIGSLGRIGTDRVAIIESNDYYSVDEMMAKNGELPESIKEDLNKVTDVLKKFYYNDYDISDKLINQIKAPLDNLASCLVNSPSSLIKLKALMDKNRQEVQHGVNVAMLSILICHWSGEFSEDIEDIAMAGILHDIGKIRIPSSILNKASFLSAEENKIIKKHAHDGVKMVRKFENISENVVKGILHHHERLDGSGYPQSLKEDQIHRIGKIIAIADIYESLTTKRVYQNKITPYLACQLLLKGSYSGKTDIKLTNKFAHGILELYIGSTVKLNTGETGEVIFNNRYLLDKPLVKVNDRFIDLSNETDYSIIEIVN